MRGIALRVSICLAVALTATYGTACSAAGNTTGSFVPVKVESARELADLIANDKVVGGRYSRHYGAAPEVIADYVRNNLRLTTLKAPLKTDVFYVTRSERTRVKRKTLPAGSRVFVTRDGKPFLEWPCGNPFGRMLPLPVKATAPKPPVNIEPSVVQDTPTIVQMTAGETVEMVTLLPIEAQPTMVVAPVVPSIEPVAEVVAAPPVASSPRISAAAIAIPALLGAVSVSSSNNNPPVPEPGSLAALAIGASGIVIQLGRSRKLRRDR